MTFIKRGGFVLHSLLCFLLHFSSTMAFLYSQNNKFVIYIGRRASTGDNDYSVPDLLSMRVSELKDELKFLGVNYADCFDKESLISRLQQARDNEVANVRVANTEQDSANDSRYSDINQDPEANDEKSILENIRSMSVKELRGELGYLNIRWSDMLEKEDLVRALYQARQEAAKFSLSGKIAPSQVADLTGAEVELELSSASTPLFLDVYATWCGPCKMMVPILQQTAERLGNKIRFAKMDSDKYPQIAGKLAVEGLPTLILFDMAGTEVDRIEGALQENQLIEWIESKKIM